MDGLSAWSPAAEAAPGVSIEGDLSLGGRTVARGVAVDAAPGRWTALLGRSGTGKTTLLKTIAGLIGPPDFAGRVSATDGAPLPGRLAWMAQKDLLAPWANARENVVLGDRLRGAHPDWRRARAALRAVGLAERAEANVADLSGGERQRIALARTLMEDRPVLLLDEPFSALDAVTRAELQELAAARLAAKTVILVTHDPMEAARLAHRLYILSPDGADEIAAPEGEIPRDPGDPEVQSAAAALLARLRERP